MLYHFSLGLHWSKAELGSGRAVCRIRASGVTASILLSKLTGNDLLEITMETYEIYRQESNHASQGSNQWHTESLRVTPDRLNSGYIRSTANLNQHRCTLAFSTILKE
jgi:hypothetical protein